MATIRDIPAGTLFRTHDGTLAVKSEYRLAGADCPMCIIVGTGEYYSGDCGAVIVIGDERQRIRDIVQALKETHRQRIDIASSHGERAAHAYTIGVLDVLAGYIDGGATVDEILAAAYA